MSEMLTNPAVTGVLGAVAIVAIQSIWSRVMGSPEEKSLPVQLAEINLKLAEINSTLLVMKNEALHSNRSHEELKEDFWEHIREHHGGVSGSATRTRRPV